MPSRSHSGVRSRKADDRSEPMRISFYACVGLPAYLHARLGAPRRLFSARTNRRDSGIDIGSLRSTYQGIAETRFPRRPPLGSTRRSRNGNLLSSNHRRKIPLDGFSWLVGD